MSISLNREGKDGLIEWSISIASTKFFNQYWNVAIQELSIKLFQENGYFGKSQIGEVLQELKEIKSWAKNHVTEENYTIMEHKIDELEKAIPEAFVGHDDAYIYVY